MKLVSLTLLTLGLLGSTGARKRFNGKLYLSCLTSECTADYTGHRCYNCINRCTEQTQERMKLRAKNQYRWDRKFRRCTSVNSCRWESCITGKKDQQGFEECRNYCYDYAVYAYEAIV